MQILKRLPLRVFIKQINRFKRPIVHEKLMPLNKEV